MTNSYDVAHGLSQVHPGPEEPVEVAQQPGAAPATGNTARDQEMYVAGIRTGEENAKHNAAIRAGAAPGVSTVEDERAERAAFNAAYDGLCNRPITIHEIAWRMWQTAAGTRPSRHPDDIAVDRFAVAMKAKLAKKRAEGRGGWSDKSQCTAEFLSQLLRGHVEKGDPVDVGNLAMMLHQRGEAIAPAAGDAPAESAPEWATCESRGPWARNSLKAAIDLLREKETRARHAFTKDYMGLPARYIADAYGEAAAVVERKLGAIAAQRKGDA